MNSLILALAFVSAASACSVPVNSCTDDKCNSYAAFDNIWTVGAANSKRNYLGELIGVPYNSASGLNLEYFDGVIAANVVASNQATSLPDCCRACRQHPKCVYFHFFKSVDEASKLAGFSDLPPGKQTRCLLLGAKAGKMDKGISNPSAPTRSSQAAIKALKEPTSGPAKPGSDAYVLSYVGGRCPANIKDDPHLIGGHGTPFDFNGKLDRSFCLTSDKNLHINVMLRGYEDTRTNGATVQANGKALRSWIKEVGLLWVSADGKSHSLHLVARAGKQQERGDGFLAKVSVNGQDAPIPQIGSTIHGDGGLALSLVAVEKTGPFDVDVFTLNIDGVAELELRMRVAHPALQSPEDAQAHFNLFLSDIRPTSAIHGVLGQTYRETNERSQRAVKYSEIASLLHAPVAADGATGKGFLDGSVEDYVTPNILSPGCKFSAFSA